MPVPVLNQRWDALISRDSGRDLLQDTRPTLDVAALCSMSSRASAASARSACGRRFVPSSAADPRRLPSSWPRRGALVMRAVGSMDEVVG